MTHANQIDVIGMKLRNITRDNVEYGDSDKWADELFAIAADIHRASETPVAWRWKFNRPHWPFWEQSEQYKKWQLCEGEPSHEDTTVEPLYAAPPSTDGLRADLAAMTQRVEAAEKDAARYRWLRENLGKKVSHWFCTDRMEVLDAAIDAERQEAKS